MGGYRWSGFVEEEGIKAREQGMVVVLVECETEREQGGEGRWRLGELRRRWSGGWWSGDWVVARSKVGLRWLGESEEKRSRNRGARGRL